MRMLKIKTYSRNLLTQCIEHKKRIRGLPNVLDNSLKPPNVKLPVVIEEKSGESESGLYHLGPLMSVQNFMAIYLIAGGLTDRQDDIAMP